MGHESVSLGQKLADLQAATLALRLPGRRETPTEDQRQTSIGVPAKARLIIGDAGVSLIDHQTATVRWEDVRRLERGRAGTTLHIICDCAGSNLTHIPE